jgi:hypothetical protein
VRGLARSLLSKLGVEIQKRKVEAMEAIPEVDSVGLVGQYPPLHIAGTV